MRLKIMKKIVSAALLSLVTGATTTLFIQPAQADRVIYCTPDTHTNVLKDPADHPDAYADGYREGQQSARAGEAYRPRATGGEFARGFDDGYYNRRYTGQQYVAPTRIEQYTTQNCNDAYETVVPPPTVIYNNPPPTVIYDNPSPVSIYVPFPPIVIGGYYGRGYYGRGYYGWGHYGR
jgi:hypothetical protein